MRAWFTMTCGNSDRPSSVSCTRPARNDARPVVLIWPPEHGLVHPVSLGNETLAEPERFEHLDRAASDAVRLPELERTLLVLDNPRGDPRNSAAAPPRRAQPDRTRQ